MDVGDTGSATLPDGRLLYSTRAGNQIQIYDPTTDKWTLSGTSPLGSGDENAWAVLQNGGILAVGYSQDGAAIYNTATGTWQRTGAVPAGFDTGDTGGISLMFDGRVYVYGLNGKSYIYTPGATGADPGTWTTGSLISVNGSKEAEDEFSITIPDGRVFGSLVTVTYGAGVVLQGFDPSTNTASSVTPPPDTGNAYPIGYVNLPTGETMATCGNNNWIYKSDLQPQDAWRPTVTSVTFNSGTTYTLTGTQLSGLINGSDEGDDMTNQANYPIVWLTNSSGNVYYCRSFNFSSMAPSKGSAVETAQFTTPAGLPSGTYNLYVSAVGVQSKNPFTFTTGMSSTASSSSSTSSSTGSSSSAAGSSSSVSSSSMSAGSGSSSGSSGASTSGTASGSASSATGSGSGSGTGTQSGGSGSTGTGLGNGSSSVGSAGSPSTGGSSGASGQGSGFGPTQPSGCGCATLGRPAGEHGAGALLCLVGALAVAERRRRSAPTRRQP